MTSTRWPWFDPLALHPGQLVVELISQRRQRPAAIPADDDFANQVTGQPVRKHRTRHPQDVR
jgi:hypothetical protein